MLLRNPLYSVTEIALICGFSNSAVFSRSFIQHFQISPTEWKRRNNSESELIEINNLFENYCPTMLDEINGFADALESSVEDLIYFYNSYLKDGNCRDLL